jgi:hypothetical protein
MSAKPAAAFAAGLWIGAVVGAAIVAFYLRVWETTRREEAPPTSAERVARDEEVRSLRREQAQLAAEAQALKQTVAELNSRLEGASATDPLQQIRRVPFRTPAPPSVESSDAWIAQALTNGDLQSLPRLEELASRNNEAALEALALMSDRDNGAALTRVWNASSLSFANKVKATRYLAGTLESNPHAVEILQSLFGSSATDLRLLYAAADGAAKPGVDATFNPNASPPLPAPPQPNFDLRVQLLDEFAASATDQHLRDHIDQDRDALLSRWVQAEPAAQ